jgi:hypothetical protein
MGFFDTVKAKAGDLAEGAERAGRVGAAQTKLAVLQNDLKKMERELGHQVFALAERGELDHPELTAALSRVRAARDAVAAKEAEISGLRASGDEEPAEARTCASCGAGLAVETTVCPECGAAATEPSQTSPPPPVVAPPTVGDRNVPAQGS